jgi:hypothetical protein
MPLSAGVGTVFLELRKTHRAKSLSDTTAMVPGRTSSTMKLTTASGVMVEWAAGKVVEHFQAWKHSV